MLLLFLVGALVAIFLLYPHLIHKPHKETLENEIWKKCEELKNIISIVVNHLQLETAFRVANNDKSLPHYIFILPFYEIVPSEQASHTKNNIVYLRLSKYDHSQLRSNRELILELLHEISFLIYEEDCRGIEQLLTNTAKKLGYV